MSNAPLLFDLLALCGLAALAYGIYQLGPTACWICGGAAVVGVAIAAARRW